MTRGKDGDEYTYLCGGDGVGGGDVILHRVDDGNVGKWDEGCGQRASCAVGVPWSRVCYVCWGDGMCGMMDRW